MKRSLGFLIFILNSGILIAQNQFTDNLQVQFHNYTSQTLQEKLYVHTDKDFYLSGETIWFKVYDVDGSFHIPLSASSIAYIEIINRDQKPVIQSKIYLKEGSGNGSCLIPASLITGNYTFRAYTNWMKNFPPEYYYEQTIHIVNTLKATIPLPSPKSSSDIQFFPESGNSVVGIQGKIAFKATDPAGNGLDCGGIILNAHKDTICSFRAQHNGMGNFLLRPEKNMTYYAVLYLKDSMIIQKLPEAIEQGFTMSISESADSKINVVVRASSEFTNTNVYLFAQTRQVINSVQTNTIKNGEARFEVEKKDLGPGISCFTLFNSHREPVSERLVFKRPEENLIIQANTDQSVYQSRKPVHIDLSTSSGPNRPLQGNLSLSVFMIDSLQTLPNQNIISYLLLSSDLRGRVESPDYYFTHTDKASDEALDNLMLTQGWRRFKWEDVFAYKKAAFEFLPELQGPVVNGKIVDKITGTPVPATGAFLSIPGSDYAFSSATSNTQGNIRFAFKDIYKNNIVVLQTAQQKDSNYRIDISSSFSDRYASRFMPPLTLERKQQQILLNRSIGMQVENTYGIEKKRVFATPLIDTTSFYGLADKIYVLNDYTHFVTMEEVLREYVEDVRIRRDGNKYSFKVRDRLFGTYFEGDPLILLDGIPISDPAKIIAQDPAKIQKIELVTHTYYTGSSVVDGIINIRSYSGELGATQLDPNALVVEYEGLQQERIFYSPVYSSKDEEFSHLPDFRNVLYWAPQIITDENGKAQVQFYTSDLKGRYAVVVQGISGNGLPGTTTIPFEVNDSK